MNAAPRIEVVRRLPTNAAEFVHEIAAGLGKLYGPKAAEHYLRTAEQTLAASMAHPLVMTWTVRDDDGDTAMLMGVVRESIAHLAFLHVLRRAEGQGLESRLIERAVAHYRASTISGIVCEFIPMCATDLDETFNRLGFERIERVLLQVPLHERGIAQPALRNSVPVESADWLELAETIVAAYSNHPGRRLHAEVRSIDGALAFIQSVASGAFGVSRAGYIRGIRRDGVLAGAIFGCEAAPEVGFVLQVAVRPEFHNSGLGTQLLRDLAQIFREAGFNRAALGVTIDNPALRLYQRLGFTELLPVTAYVWWR